MSFQPTVNFNQGFGIPGEIYDSGPIRCEPYILNSDDTDNNVFGRGFCVSGQGTASGSITPAPNYAAAGNNDGDGGLPFAGILVNPKNHASFGTSVDGPLAPTLTLANGVDAQFLTMGAVIVQLSAAAAIGDYVVYDNTTGELSTITPTTELPSGKSPAFAYVDRFPITGTDPTLAVIVMQPSLVYVPAS